jgi:hypothetical protein
MYGANKNNGIIEEQKVLKKQRKRKNEIHKIHKTGILIKKNSSVCVCVCGSRRVQET